MRTNRLSERASKENVSEQELLIQLYDQFGSQTGVAAELGISQGRLSQIIREHGLTTKQVLVKRE
jgi:DNA-directed RNA polymerase specialized sigma subunit